MSPINSDTKPLNDIISKYLAVFSQNISIKQFPILDIRINDDLDQSNVDIDIIGKEFIDKTIIYNFIHVLIHNIKLLIDAVYNHRFNKNIEDDYISVDTVNSKISIYMNISYDPLYNNQELVTNTNTWTNKPKINKEILDQIYNSVDSWDLLPIDRSIDMNKAKEYIRSLPDDKSKNIAITLINNTKYITFNELKETLINQVIKLPDQFNLYFDITGNKIGSEHWLVMVLWPYIKDKIVKVINVPEDIHDNLPLVIIDDAMYSGQQMLNLLNYIVHHFNYWDDNIENKIQPMIGQSRVNNKFLNTNICLVIGYISNTALVKLSEYATILYNTDYGRISLFHGNLISNIYDYLIDENNRTEKILLALVDYMAKNFGVLDTNMALYFDHKIAGVHSSLPFYTQIVKKIHSREKIELLKNKLEPYRNTDIDNI